MANCIVCGKEYTPKRKDQKWCCEECKKKYRNDKRRKEHPDKVCKYCGKSFSPKKDTQNFCCKRCREKYFEENRPKREYKVKCSECGKEFVASRNKTEKENLKFVKRDLPSNMSSKYNLKDGILHYCKNYKKQYMEFNNNFLLQPERLNEKTS